MKIMVNGSAREVGDGTTVTEIVRAAHGTSAGPGVAVAVNGEVVTRATWDDTVLHDGDRVEIVVATQGG